MIPYYLLTSILLISGIISLDKTTIRYRTITLYTLCIVTILFSGCRACGWDYESYMMHFKRVPEVMHYVRTDMTVELGYEFFASLCKSIFSNYNVFLFIFAAINIILAGILCEKYSPNPVFSFILFCGVYLYGQVMGQMRQPMAISITYLLSLPLLVNNMRWRAVVWTIIVGILFHKSTILIALCLPFSNIKVSNRQFLLLCGICGIIFVSPSLLSAILWFIIPKSFYLYDVMVAYMTYLSQTFSFTFGMLERVGLLFICVYYGKKYRLYDTDVLYRIMTNLFAMGVFIYFSFIQLASEFASRGTKGLYFSIIFLLPILIYRTNGIDKMIITSVTILWISYLYISFLVNPPELYNPYISVLD